MFTNDSFNGKGFSAETFNAEHPDTGEILSCPHCEKEIDWLKTKASITAHCPHCSNQIGADDGHHMNDIGSKWGTDDDELYQIETKIEQERDRKGFGLSAETFNAEEDDMERYMNMAWKKYTPRQKMDMQLMDLHYGHTNKNTKRHFKKGYEYGWKLARYSGFDMDRGARAKDLLTTSPRKDGFLVDAGAYAGFDDSWRFYEGELKAESHAYSYAYNEGHSDSRKDDGYNPIKSKQDLVPFKRVLKQKAEFDENSQVYDEENGPYKCKFCKTEYDNFGGPLYHCDICLANGEDYWVCDQCKGRHGLWNFQSNCESCEDFMCLDHTCIHSDNPKRADILHKSNEDYVHCINCSCDTAPYEGVKNAESFSADERKFVELLVEYNLPGDPEYIAQLLTGANMKIIEMKYVDVYGAESNYPKGEKGYVIYSLGYNEGEQGKGRKTPESFVSMIAKFNDIENSYMLSDDDKAYTIYTLGYFDGESDKIDKRTPQAFELMLSKMGKSYGKPLLSSIPKTERLDVESFSADEEFMEIYKDPKTNEIRVKGKWYYPQIGSWEEEYDVRGCQYEGCAQMDSPEWYNEDYCTTACANEMVICGKNKPFIDTFMGRQTLNQSWNDGSYGDFCQSLTKDVEGVEMCNDCDYQQVGYGAETFSADGEGWTPLIAPTLDYEWETDDPTAEVTQDERDKIEKDMGDHSLSDWSERGKMVPDSSEVSIDIKRDGKHYMDINGEWEVDWGAESFEATKGIDTFTEPLEEIGVPKWLIGIGGVVAAITGINYLSKKL